MFELKKKKEKENFIIYLFEETPETVSLFQEKSTPK